MIDVLLIIGTAAALLSLLVIASAMKVSGRISREEELKEWQRLKEEGSNREKEAQEMD